MLVTLADMKSYLGLMDATYDAFLTSQLEMVSEAVEEYCNRSFLQATYTQTFYQEQFEDPFLVRSLPLFHFPLISLTSVEEKEEDASTPTPITEYRFHKPTAILTKNVGGKFFHFGKILEVVYEAGYAYADLPKTLQHVVYSVVEERFNKKKLGINLNFGSDVQRISIPGTISIDYDYSLQANERKSHLGAILGNHLNILDGHRSERAVMGTIRESYVI